MRISASEPVQLRLQGLPPDQKLRNHRCTQMDTDRKQQEQGFSPAQVWLLQGDAGRGNGRSGIGLPESVFICVHLWFSGLCFPSVSSLGSLSAFQPFSFCLRISPRKALPTAGFGDI